jgi:hypothetical protein
MKAKFQVIINNSMIFVKNNLLKINKSNKKLRIITNIVIKMINLLIL